MHGLHDYKKILRHFHFKILNNAAIGIDGVVEYQEIHVFCQLWFGYFMVMKIRKDHCLNSLKIKIK